MPSPWQPSRDSQAAQVRRLVSRSSSSPSTSALVAMVFFFTLKRARTSDLQRIRCEERKAREPVLVRNLLQHRQLCLELAPALFPRRDAVILWAVHPDLALVGARNHSDAASDFDAWMPLLEHARVGTKLSQW